MTYNQTRHIQLLRRSQSFKNQGKSFYRENKDEYLEFSRYEGTIQSYIDWKNRTLLVLLMEKFVTRIISGEEFDASFAKFHQRLTYECDNFTDDFQNEEFYDSIKDCFLKLQKVLNEE